jgi:hypothetical protein
MLAIVAVAITSCVQRVKRAETQKKKSASAALALNSFLEK